MDESAEYFVMLVITFIETFWIFYNLYFLSADFFRKGDSNKIKEYRRIVQETHKNPTGETPLVNLDAKDIAEGNWNTYRTGWVINRYDDGDILERAARRKADGENLIRLETTLGDFDVEESEYMVSKNGDEILVFYKKGEPLCLLLKKFIDPNSDFYNWNYKGFFRT